MMDRDTLVWNGRVVACPVGALVVAGQHIITATGQRAVVAFVGPDGVVHAWSGRSPMPCPVIVRGDAWGGEHDMTNGLAT